ncbi:AAA family ATPase [Cellulomonas humilata]|uniref:AAA family ATPase n=1 Tax=Cellulomonas humilata TaxID=144055 RepID=A0A7Y6A0W2_9CELL|nr:AAA family ATPase [Cellulomonas humilata]
MLHGRDVERARLAALVDGARQGRAGTLALHGDPGTGKTALLDDLAEACHGVTVLRTQGIESESPLAFASLHRLLRPLLPRLDHIPAPQAGALDLAFGRQDGDAVDPFLVAVATLSLVTEAAEHQPVLAMVDDAHWLDAASADVLLFTARRLDADQVVLLFSVRDGQGTSFSHPGVPSLLIRELDDASARAVVEDHLDAGAKDSVTTDRVLRQAGGNPLALVELSTALTSDQLQGAEPLPVTAAMERVFLDRARRLPERVQRFLLIVAADDSGRVATVRRAAEILAIPDRAFAEAEASGLMLRAGDTLRVRHPLVRSALYQAAPTSLRGDVHRALAAALEGVGEPDRQVWHDAFGADGPDAAIAARLDGAGVRSERRGGHAAAADFFERAAELSPAADLRAERRFSAARNAWAASLTARARSLVTAARGEADDPSLLADIDRLRGRIEVNVGSAATAHRIFVSAAVAAVDTTPARALDLAVAAAGLAAYGGDSGIRLDPAIVIRPGGDPDDSRARTLHDLLLAMTAASQHQWPQAVERLRDAAQGAVDGDADLLAHLGQAAVHLGDDTTAGHAFAAMLGTGRQSGAGMTVLYALPRQAFPLFLSGQWSAVRRSADEAHRLSTSVGQPALSATPLAWLALLAALRGEDVAPDLRAELDEVVEHHPLGILAAPTADLIRWADGARAAQAGAAEVAIHHVTQMRVPALTRMAAIDRITAAVHADQPEQATEWLGELVPFAQGTRWPWALGAVEHARALLSPQAAAPAHFEQSLTHYVNAARPFDLARTHLAYGQHLRRAQHRVDARLHLRRALESFEDLRAAPLSAVAARELRAAGETARTRDVSTLVQLTPMELQVAQLVSQGMSNKEVAAHCWVSPRTVGFHLRNCFAKTGVSSRGELAQLSLG